MVRSGSVLCFWIAFAICQYDQSGLSVTISVRMGLEHEVVVIPQYAYDSVPCEFYHHTWISLLAIPRVDHLSAPIADSIIPAGGSVESRCVPITLVIHSVVHRPAIHEVRMDGSPGEHLCPHLIGGVPYPKSPCCGCKGATRWGNARDQCSP